MTQAEQALAAIHAYLAGRPPEVVDSCTVWEAVIQRAEGYDEELSARADPSQANEQAMFADGSRLWWNFSLQAWEAEPAESSAS